jgi:hypothetical protein
VPEYRFIGTHADQLASGRQVAPGDKVPASAVITDKDNPDPLLAEGLLIEIPAKKKEASN